MPGVLDGLLVLDFSTLLPGPMAGLFLADAGAQVIKIEPPVRGEDMRHYPPQWGRDGASFNLLNRGKKSLAINLKDPEERGRLEPLLRQADILIEQFRPGVMQRLGLGYETVRKLNPNIIYCSITGYGQTGPKSQRAGHDLNYIGDAGVLSLSHGQEDSPTVPPALMADIAGGAYPAVINILMALRARDAGEGGAHIDVSMAESMLPFLFWAMGSGQAAGEWPESGEALLTGGSPRYQIYPTSDGHYLAAAPLEDKFWDAFGAAIGLEPALRDDGRDSSATKRRVSEIIKEASASHWEAVFQEADCCCTIVRTVQEALSDPHFQGRGMFARQLENTSGGRMPALPLPIAPQFRRDDGDVGSAPALGADNEGLLNRDTKDRVTGNEASDDN